jgi:UDP-N-acetylglucosamine transferase subunit ALG13
MPTVLVTVGSTLFDDLINVFQPDGAVFKALEEAHLDKLIIQYGKGSPPRKASGSKLRVEAFPFSDEIDKLIAESDLVISHAGEHSRSLCRPSH